MASPAPPCRALVANIIFFRDLSPSRRFNAGLFRTVGFAAPIALAAMAFGKYFRGVFDFGSPVVLSFVLVWVVALFHFGNLRLGSAFQNLWTIVKLFLISVLIGAGFFVEQKQAITFLPQPGDTMSIFSGVAVALVYVKYSYWLECLDSNYRGKGARAECVALAFCRHYRCDWVYVLLNAVFS